jgi:NAD(P) transhydrogenase
VEGSHCDPAGSDVLAGRQGVTDELDLEKAGLAADRRGRITVDRQHRTAVAHIFAVGDVVGFPALAVTSMNQGRLAAYHASANPPTSCKNCSRSGFTPCRRSLTAAGRKPS